MGPARRPVGLLPALHAREIARPRPQADRDTLIVARPESAARETQAARREATAALNTDITGLGVRLWRERPLRQNAANPRGAGA